MNVGLIVLFVLFGVAMLVSMIFGLVLLIRTMARSLGGARGGWGKLLAAYSTHHSPAGQLLKRQTLRIGVVVYKRCVTLGIADEGLYVTIWGKTVLIPWQEFRGLGQTMLYWQQVPLVTIGEPPVATTTLPLPVFELLRARLPQGLAVP